MSSLWSIPIPYGVGIGPGNLNSLKVCVRGSNLVRFRQSNHRTRPSLRINFQPRGAWNRSWPESIS